MTIRSLASEDRAFVTDAWARHYAGSQFGWLRKAHPDLSRVAKSGFMARHRPAVCLWLNRGTTLVAALTEAPDIVIGFSCGEVEPETGLTVLHYCYTRAGYRGQGAGRALLAEMQRRLGESDRMVVTHQTIDGQKMIGKAIRVPWVAWT